MKGRINKSAKGCTEPVKGKKGVYRLYFSLGKDPVSGKYLRTSRRTYHCKSKNPNNWRTELDNALAEYRQELEGAGALEGRAYTVPEYAEEFHAMAAGTMGSPLAYKRAGLDVKHIRELFDGIALESLRPDDIMRAYAHARESGRFSESEIRRIHVKLKQVMKNALENELVARNPCDSVKLPKADRNERETLNPEEASRLLGCLLKEEPSSAIVCTMVLLYGGLRKGEALGLSWGDYDEEAGTLRISKQYTNDKVLRPPKSKMSNRVIAIDEAMSFYLDCWKIRQQTILSELGFEQDDETPIVHSVGIRRIGWGERFEVVRMDPCNYGRWFRNFSVDNGFGRFTKDVREFEQDGVMKCRGKGYEGLQPHGLRHTQATLLIASGVDIKTVQKRLGHADVSTTLNLYTRAVEANDRKASKVIGAIIQN